VVASGLARHPLNQKVAHRVFHLIFAALFTHLSIMSSDVEMDDSNHFNADVELDPKVTVAPNIAL
jgi:hypothetical protein